MVGCRLLICGKECYDVVGLHQEERYWSKNRSLGCPKYHDERDSIEYCLLVYAELVLEISEIYGAVPESPM